MAQIDRSRFDTYTNNTSPFKGFTRYFVYKSSGYTSTLNGTTLDPTTYPSLESSKNIQDYIHMPGTPFTKSQPTNFLDYYASNPSFKGCVHEVQDVVIHPSPPSTISAEVSRYEMIFDLDGYPPYTQAPASLWLNPLIVLADGANYYGDFIKPIGFIPDTSGDLAVIRSMLDDNRLMGVEDINLLQSLAELRDASKLLNLVKFHKINDGMISDKYLGVNFGVLPLVNDLKKVSSLIKNIKPAFDKWNDQAKRGAIRNAHRTISEDTYEGTFRDYNNHSLGGIYYTIEVIAEYRQVITRRAHLYYRPRPMSATDYDRLQKSLWGLHKPLSAAWELVPFSFVVDWVANIGDLIQDFESSEPVAELDIYCGGVTTKIETVVTCRPGIRFWGQAPEFHPMGEVVHTYTKYDRQPIMPDTLSSLFEDKNYGPLEFSPVLSGNQTVLGAALVHQFLRR